MRDCCECYRVTAAVFFQAPWETLRLPSSGMSAPADIPNISAWRLNKAEQKELTNRVAKGEVEKEVKREIQTRKAVACEERKRSAEAIASKSESAPLAVKKVKKGPAVTIAATAGIAAGDATNSAYYAQIEGDLHEDRCTGTLQCGQGSARPQCARCVPGQHSTELAPCVRLAHTRHSHVQTQGDGHG